MKPSVPASQTPATPQVSRPVAVSYTDLTPNVHASSVEQIRARRTPKRWRANLLVLVGLVVLMVVGVAAYRAYEDRIDEEAEADFSAVCAIDKRSLTFAVEAFRGDLGQDADSFDELVRYGLLSEMPTDWMIVPDPDEPGRTTIEPTPDGRCA